MSTPSPTTIRISTDGSTINNGYPDAAGGYAMVIELNNAVGLVTRTLCPTCDANMQTNNRAELRAMEAAIMFLHEMGKSGCSNDCKVTKRGKRGSARANVLSDRRSIYAHNIIGIVRTDSKYVLNGVNGTNAQNVHRKLWQNVNNCKKCMVNAGMDFRCEFVRAHSGDWANERADKLAKKMALANVRDCNNVTEVAWCDTCEQLFETVFDLAAHFKQVHVGRDLIDEIMSDAVFLAKESGRFECSLCEKNLASAFALSQHLTDKHGHVLE